MISVLLADDHALIRDSLCSMLERAGDIQVVATAANGLEAISQAAVHSPDIAVMDISMPVMSGLDAIGQIRTQSPATRVMMLSAYGDPEYVRRALEAGACGFVIKDTAGEDLVAAIRLVHMGKRYFSQKVAEAAKKHIKQTGDDRWLG
jgi:two-component system response regulator NreC